MVAVRAFLHAFPPPMFPVMVVSTADMVLNATFLLISALLGWAQLQAKQAGPARTARACVPKGGFSCDNGQRISIVLRIVVFSFRIYDDHSHPLVCAIIEYILFCGSRPQRGLSGFMNHLLSPFPFATFIQSTLHSSRHIRIAYKGSYLA
jgi:cytochrome c oxidase assembly factor CtaG